MTLKFVISPAPGYICGEQFADGGVRTGAVFMEGKLVEKAYNLDDINVKWNTSSIHIEQGAYCGYFMPFFGHLLTEFLPRYEQLKLMDRLDLPILVHPAPWVREPEKQLRDFPPIPEFLKELGISFDMLHFCCSDVDVDSLFHTSNTIKLGQNVGEEMVDIANSLRARFNFVNEGKKIFLSRSRLESSFRKADNALEIDRIFQDFGFEILHPQEMPLRQQIAKVSSATVIAGEEGSAMHLSMFNPMLKTCIILDSGRFTRPAAAIDTQKLLNERLGCQTIYCPPTNIEIDHQTAVKMQAGGRFTVDVENLSKTLEAILE